MKTILKTFFITAAFAISSNCIHAQVPASQDSMKRQNRMHTSPTDSIKNNSNTKGTQKSESVTPGNQNRNSVGSSGTNNGNINSNNRGGTTIDSTNMRSIKDSIK